MDNNSINPDIKSVDDDEQTYVKISEDETLAWLYLTEKENKEPYTKEEIYSYLRSNGVVAGFHESNIAAMAKKGVFQREIKIAHAIKPVQGTNGYYDYNFYAEETRRHPVVREDGSVDYQSMSVLDNIKKGETLAVYHPAVEGENGITVKGTILQAEPVKDLPTLKGKGFTSFEEDPNVYVAMEDGKVEYRDGRTSISKVHQILGDVDLITGKIDFYGDVVISGNVEAGVIIRAGKSLTIEGTVESADIFAGGDIVLKRGIQGNHKAKVITKGNFYADFIEHTQVRVGMNVEANTILNSEIVADGKVVATGKKGLIIGGSIHATGGVDCKELGNDNEVRTVVHVGVQTEVLELFKDLTKAEQGLKEQLSEVEEELRNTIPVGGEDVKIPHLLTQRIKALRDQRAEIDKKLQEASQRRAECGFRIEQSRGSTVRIDGNLYRGSVIQIDNNQMLLENNTCFMEYKNVSNMIVGSVIISN